MIRSMGLLAAAVAASTAPAFAAAPVEARTESGELLVNVQDTGPGIPVENQAMVFEQYWQDKGNQPLRGSKGSGIGLAFCQRVLDAHGERIWVEDEGPLSGASFAFTLPIA